MARSRTVLVVLTLVLAALPGLSLAADDARVAQLEQRLDAMEKRMASLEANLSRQLQAIQSKMAQPAAPAPAAAPNPLEQEAQTAYGPIARAVAAGNMDEAKKLMDDFMGKYGSTQTAAKARKTFSELSVIGKSAPTDWGIEKWFQGESDVKLNSDKTTLVVFWEEWCPHCRREVPKLQQIYSSLHDQGLQVVGLTRITKSSTEEKVQDFLAQQKVSYPVAKENGNTANYFNVGGIPAAAVIKGGKVVWRGHPAALNEAMLKGWL